MHVTRMVPAAVTVIHGLSPLANVSTDTGVPNVFWPAAAFET